MTAGVNVGPIGSDTTDANGEATATYSSSVGGVDTIVATTAVNVVSNDVHKTWNSAPTPNPVVPPIVECAPVFPGGTPVLLDGTASFDPDGDPLTFIWTNVGTGLVVSTLESVVVQLGLGVHTFTLTVSDGIAPPVTSAPVTVNVVDTTPPVIMVTTAEVKVEPHFEGTLAELVALFGASISDICDPNPVLDGGPNGPYPLGATTVTFTGVDASGNPAADVEVTVIVTPRVRKQEVMWSLADHIEPLPPSTGKKKKKGMPRLSPVQRRLRAAYSALERAIDPTLWDDTGMTVLCPDGKRVFDLERTAVRNLQALLRLDDPRPGKNKKKGSGKGKKKAAAQPDPLDPALVAWVEQAIADLVEVDQALAEAAIAMAADAVAANPTPKGEKALAKAEAQLAKGNAAAAAGKPTVAIHHYRQAFVYACKAKDADTPSKKAKKVKSKKGKKASKAQSKKHSKGQKARKAKRGRRR